VRLPSHTNSQSSSTSPVVAVIVAAKFKEIIVLHDEVYLRENSRNVDCQAPMASANPVIAHAPKSCDFFSCHAHRHSCHFTRAGRPWERCQRPSAWIAHRISKRSRACPADGSPAGNCPRTVQPWTGIRSSRFVRRSSGDPRRQDGLRIRQRWRYRPVSDFGIAGRNHPRPLSGHDSWMPRGHVLEHLPGDRLPVRSGPLHSDGGDTTVEPTAIRSRSDGSECGETPQCGLVILLSWDVKAFFLSELAGEQDLNNKRFTVDL
jgi:hypothetical protein